MNRLKRWLRYWLRLEVLTDDDEMVDPRPAAFVILIVLIIVKGLL